MRTIHLAISLMLLAALALSACQQQPATSQPTAPPAANTNEAPPQPEPAANDNQAGGDEPVEVDDVAEGLAAFDSYIATFEMQFEGTDTSGQSVSSSIAWVEAYSKNPPARRTAITSAGDDAGSFGSIETIVVDGITYSIFGDICTSSEGDEGVDDSLTFSPSDVIGGISSAQFVGVENVNGVQTRHLVVDLSAQFSAGVFTDGQADAWITENGAVVRYILEATGADLFFGGGEGSLRWEYNVTNINQPVDITAPEDCGGAPDDVPLTEDATDVVSFGDLTSYTTSAPLADVVAFYREEMPANGWTATEGGFDTENFATLNFSKDDRTASITITADPSTNTTSVLIQITE